MRDPQGLNKCAYRGGDLSALGRWVLKRENRSILWLAAVLLLGYAAVLLALALWNPDVPAWLTGDPKKAANRDTSAVEVVLFFTFAIALGLLVPASVHLKAKNVRLMEALDERHGAAYRDQLWMEHNEERRQWYRERDEWKAKTQAELYEMILDQVERGVLKPRSDYPDEGYKYPNAG